MNNIEGHLLTLVSGNSNRNNGIRVIENRSGLNFMDMLNSRINTADDLSAGEKKSLERPGVRNDPKIYNESPENTHTVPSEGEKKSEESVVKEDPFENKVRDTGKEEVSGQKRVKEPSAGGEKKKVSGSEETENEDIHRKERILQELEELGLGIEGIEIEDLKNPELNRLIEMLKNMIDVINPSDETSPMKLQIKNLLSEIKEAGEDLLLKQKNPVLKEAAIKRMKGEITKLTSLMGKAIDEMKNGKPDLKDILTKINSLVERIAVKGKENAAGHALNDTGFRGQTAENTMTLLNKIDALLSQAVNENGGGSFESGSEREGHQGGLNMNFMKNLSGKNISVNESRAMNNSRFSQQMQSIIENAKVVVKDSRNGSFAVKLYPKQLGIVNVNLGLEQGVVNGKFFVENGEARDLLMENLNLIKEQLEEAGINIGEFEVNVNHQGEMFTRDDTEETFFTLPGTGDEVAKEYHTNSLSLHDGEFNMVI
jgi:flagellar hook-length control protein FliK